MTEEVPGKKLDTEAEVYIKVGKLLKKNRSHEAQELVFQVLNSEISMDDKIKRIQEIDASDKSVIKEHAVINENEIAEILTRYNVTTEETANKNINYLKKPIYKKQFFQFFFKEYFKIRNYAKDSRILHLTAFSVKLNFKKYLLVSLQKEASLLLNYINPVLETGWTLFTKFEYNLLNQFKKLCEDISRTDLTYNNNEIQFLAKIKSIESRFLICNYQPEYPDIISRCLSEFMRDFLKQDVHIEHVVTLTKKILLPSGDQHSLYHIILGLNIVIFRQFFSLEDLIQRKSGAVINDFNFDCSDSINNKIDFYISDNEKILKDLLHQKSDIIKMNHFLKQFIRKDETGKERYKFALLVSFYESGSGLDKFWYNRDKDNLLIFTNNLMIRFNKEIEPFLTRSIGIENWGEINVFTPDFFYFELSKIKTVENQLSKMAVASVQVSVDRFREVRKNIDSGNLTKDEVFAVQIVDEISNLMVDLGKKTGQLYQTYRPEPDNPEINKTQEKIFKPLDPSILVRNGFFVPFWDQKINISGVFQDKTFGEILNIITSICLLIGAFFSGSKMMSSLEKEAEVNNEIIRVKQNLERVADVITFEKIKRTYHI